MIFVSPVNLFPLSVSWRPSEKSVHAWSGSSCSPPSQRPAPAFGCPGHFWLFHSSLYPLIHLSSLPSTHPPIYPITHSSTHLPIHPSAHPPTHPFSHPPTNPPSHPPIHPPVHPPIYSSIPPFLHPPASLSFSIFLVLNFVSLTSVSYRRSKFLFYLREH